MQDTGFVSIGKNCTIAQAAKLMNDKSVSSVFVVDKVKTVGEISDKQIIKVLASNLSPKVERVQDHMICASMDVSSFLQKGISHLPYNKLDSTQYELASGHLYYIQNSHEQRYFEVFLNNLKGNFGLVITSLLPEYVRERYGLINTPVITLGKDVDLKNIDALYRSVRDHLMKRHHLIVLLHGMHELLLRNDGKKVRQFLSQFRKLVCDTSAIGFVAIDPQNHKQANLLFSV